MPPFSIYAMIASAYGTITQRVCHSVRVAPAKRSRGFTLIEMLVSLAIFAIVMVICVGALLSLVVADKKAQALESVMNNLNITIDDMVRGIREGHAFDGSFSGTSNGATGCSGPNGKDCTSGTQIFAFTPYSDPNGLQTVYQYASGSNCGAGYTGGCIMMGIDGIGGSSLMPVTAPEVNITGLKFYVVGTAPGTAGNTDQPRVIISIKGVAGTAGVKTSSTFELQATAVQRVLDL